MMIKIGVSCLFLSLILPTVASRAFGQEGDVAKGGGGEAKEVWGTTPNAAVIYWQAFSAMPELTEEESKLYGEAVAGKVAASAPELQPILARYTTALAEMYRAGTVKPCDWNLDINAGPGLLLPHLQKARDLARAATLRAGARFENGQVDEAIDDVFATLAMGRAGDANPTLISLLVDYAIERLATDALAQNLGKLDPAQLDRVTDMLASLPAAATIEECMRWEERIFVDWFDQKVKAAIAESGDKAASAESGDKQGGYKLLEKICVDLGMEFPPKTGDGDGKGGEASQWLRDITPQEIIGSIGQLRADYRQIRELLNDEQGRADAIAKFEADLKSRSQTESDSERRKYYFSGLALPSLTSVCKRIDERNERLRLLGLAIEYRRGGDKGLEGADGIDFEKFEDGFQIRSRRVDGAQVTVGKRG
jgi:hypothetical protein